MFRHHHRRHDSGVTAADWTRGRHFRARAERFFDHGELRLVILRLLAEEPRHGYELIKAIEEKVGGAYSPSPGVVYPALTMLEEMGLIAGEAAGAKKLYRVTDEGHATLASEKAIADHIFARMEAVRERFGGPSPRIRRAMANLGQAIRVRVSSAPLESLQLDAIIEAIDAAARAVEKA
ncbi:MAG TPA: PadR family transcriptional regulator [Caulobacteraceae bacterium]|nr:PadR family transcriptional regulator [Caulobacteraceae bacterium]